MILNRLGIFGWPEWDENLLLASLLTGDPLLLIGNHGCAKTHVVQKLGKHWAESVLRMTHRNVCSKISWGIRISRS